jgi:hypothetical protein
MSDYPTVLVSESLIHEVKSIANNKDKQVSADLLFRMLIGTIFDDDQIWLDLTANDMIKLHHAEVEACYSKNFCFFFFKIKLIIILRICSNLKK